MVDRKTIYRRSLLAVIAVSLIGLGCYSYYLIKNAIPSQLQILAGTEDEFEFEYLSDLVSYEKSVAVSGGNISNIPENQLHLSAERSGTGSAYTLQCKLFGIINLKSIQVSVVDTQYLIPSGAQVGIYLETDGILVIGTGTITGMDGLDYEPAYNIIQSGDYIVAINSEQVENKDHMMELINHYGEEDVVLDVRRNDEMIQLLLTPVKTAQEEFKLGIWVRDDTQGIGTLTFVDTENGFGALGHGINDVDTSMLMELSGGKLYTADVLSILKGEKGTPGEISGIIHYNADHLLGEVTANTGSGIFGSITEMDREASGEPVISGEPVEICLKQDIELGPAVIRSAVDGTIREYEVEIQEINLNDSDANKGLILKVTDQELLELTGGIVQGMSGSPIIQNDKIIGAVTHVFIQDSTSGFGIFIENMLEQMN